jgi:hypothetical protein
MRRLVARRCTNGCMNMSGSAHSSIVTAVTTHGGDAIQAQRGLFAQRLKIRVSVDSDLDVVPLFDLDAMPFGRPNPKKCANVYCLCAIR